MSDYIPPRDARTDHQVAGMMIDNVIKKFNIPTLTLPRKPLGHLKGPAASHKGPRTSRGPSGRGKTRAKGNLSDY